MFQGTQVTPRADEGFDRNDLSIILSADDMTDILAVQLHGKVTLSEVKPKVKGPNGQYQQKVTM